MEPIIVSQSIAEDFLKLSEDTGAARKTIELAMQVHADWEKGFELRHKNLWKEVEQAYGLDLSKCEYRFEKINGVFTIYQVANKDSDNSESV